jgi:hypothetical protein
MKTIGEEALMWDTIAGRDESSIGVTITFAIEGSRAMPAILCSMATFVDPIKCDSLHQFGIG